MNRFPCPPWSQPANLVQFHHHAPVNRSPRYNVHRSQTTPAVERMGEALCAEFKHGLAELELRTVERFTALELRLTKQISDLDHRIERLESQRLVR